MLKLVVISIGVMWAISSIVILYDDDFKQIRPAKKLKDIFK